jgi:hypothetical protein
VVFFTELKSNFSCSILIQIVCILSRMKNVKSITVYSGPGCRRRFLAAGDIVVGQLVCGSAARRAVLSPTRGAS